VVQLQLRLQRVEHRLEGGLLLVLGRLLCLPIATELMRIIRAAYALCVAVPATVTVDVTKVCVYV
jgi:hypothetical protein